jgi:hypothetical protein
MSLLILLPALPSFWQLPVPTSEAVSLSVLCLISLYSIVAMKRVFNQGWGATLLRGVAMVMAYLVSLVVTVTSVFILYDAAKLNGALCLRQ